MGHGRSGGVESLGLSLHKPTFFNNKAPVGKELRAEHLQQAPPEPPTVVPAICIQAAPLAATHAAASGPLQWIA